MDCALAGEMINRRMDGELSPTEQVRLNAHLARCPACAGLAARMDALDDTLVVLARVNQAMLERRPATVSRRAPEPSRGAGWPLTSALAAAACLALLVLASPVFDARPEAPPGELARIESSPLSALPPVRLIGESRKRYLAAEVPTGVENVRLVYVFPVAARVPRSATQPTQEM